MQMNRVNKNTPTNTFKEKFLKNILVNCPLQIIDIYVPFMFGQSKHIHITYKHQDFNLITDLNWSDNITCEQITASLNEDIAKFDSIYSDTPLQKYIDHLNSVYYGDPSEMAHNYVLNYIFRRLLCESDVGLVLISSIQKIFEPDNNPLFIDAPYNSLEHFKHYHDLNIDLITEQLT